MKKALLFLAFVPFSLFAMEDIASMGQSLHEIIDQKLKSFYETYYSPTKTAEELDKVIIENLETTYFQKLPREIWNKLIEYVATNEFQRLFKRLVPIQIGIPIRLSTAPPDYDYVNFLLTIGANPNVIISEKTTALDAIVSMLPGIAAFKQSQELYQKYIKLEELLKSHGGKKFSELSQS